MKAGYPMWRLSLLIMLTLVGCGAPEPVLPTPTLYPTLTPRITPFKSPDGVTRAQTICWPVGIDVTCVIKFLNGKTVRHYPDSPLDWSPDGRYAVVCIGRNHDSPCGYSEVWDMIHGQLIVDAASPYCYTWSPNEPHLLGYLVESSFLATNQVEMYVMDVAIGNRLRQTTYPEWYQARWPELTPMNFCLTPLDRIVGSTERGFVGPPFD